jgi:hypothetical protein
MKFKIGDKVKIIGFPRMKCSIGDWVVNKPEELRMVDGEITYVVNHDNYRGEMGLIQLKKWLCFFSLYS